MKVLLLGASGNLGSRLVPALLAHNHTVIAYVRNEAKLKSLLPTSILGDITIVVGDATDSNTVSAALVQHKCDAFVQTSGMASLMPWQAPALQGLEKAVTSAAVTASKQLGYPLRGWFMAGVGVMDIPGLNGAPMYQYFPIYVEHSLTWALLKSQPTEHLQWSMCCPADMQPINKDIVDTRGTARKDSPLAASADVPPLWMKTNLLWLPFLGPFWACLRNGMRYSIKLEDCADFIAGELEKGGDHFVGKRVGIINAGEGKSK